MHCANADFSKLVECGIVEAVLFPIHVVAAQHHPAEGHRQLGGERQHGVGLPHVEQVFHLLVTGKILNSECHPLYQGGGRIGPSGDVGGQAVYSAGAGRFARVFVGLARGWLADPGSQPTAEDIATNLAEVSATQPFTIPMSIEEEVMAICERLGVTI